MTRTVITVLALAAIRPTLLSAQPADRTARWGITASVTPRWTAARVVADYVEADQYDISGGEFTIGFVRGRNMSGDWGVSLVRKGVKEGSTSRFGTVTSCWQQECVEQGTTFVAKNVSLLGVEAHKFFTFVTIRRRVQIGMNVAAGIVLVRGQAEKTWRYGKLTRDPGTGIQHLTQGASVSTVDGGQIFSGGNPVTYTMSAKVEAGFGFILTRDLKLRATGGINFPGYHVASVHVIYLIRRHGSLFD